MVTKKSYCYSFSSWEKIIQSTGLKIFDMKRAQRLSDMKGHLLHKNHPLSPLIHYSSNCLFSSLGALLGKKTININSLAQTLPIIIIILLLLYYYTLIYFAALEYISSGKPREIFHVNIFKCSTERSDAKTVVYFYGGGLKG